MNEELLYLRLLVLFNILWLFLYVDHALARARSIEREKAAKNKTPRIL